MSFRISTTIVRNATKKPALRAFHSPFAVLGDSPITSQGTSAAATATNTREKISAAYEKHYEHPGEPVSNSGLRTYVVSEPDAHSRHYQIPAGAYPTSSPYVNFAATSAPDTTGCQHSSTAADILAHGYTTAAAPKNASGVGESSAVRYASSPGEMGARGGGHGGLGLMDKQGTTPGKGKLGDRNPPPDGKSAEKYSKAGVKEAWKLRN